MRKKILFLIILLLLFLPPISLFAICDISNLINEKSQLSSLASNINYSTFYNEDEDGVRFSIRVNNLDKKIAVVEAASNRKVTYGRNENNPREYVFRNFRPGQVVEFNVVPVNATCLDDDEILYTSYVNLPHYNKYYKDSLCKGISNLAICQKWNRVLLDEDDFAKAILEYKKSLEKDADDDEEYQVGQIIASVFQFLKDNYLYISGGLLVAIIIIVFLRRDDFKL